MKHHPLTITKEQANKIIEEAEKTNDFDHMFFLTLKLTGRRIGELYGVQDQKEIGRKVIGQKVIYDLKGNPQNIGRTRGVYKKLKNWRFGIRVKDIDFENGTMKVWVLKRKQYVQDETIIPPELLRIMSSYINRHRLNLNNYLFRKKGRRLRNIGYTLKKYAKKVGVPIQEVREGFTYNLSPHSFRHYFVTELKRHGWNDDNITKLTGHKTTSTLKHYDHVIATDIKEQALETLKEL